MENFEIIKPSNMLLDPLFESPDVNERELIVISDVPKKPSLTPQPLKTQLTYKQGFKKYLSFSMDQDLSSKSVEHQKQTDLNEGDIEDED